MKNKTLLAILYNEEQNLPLLWRENPKTNSPSEKSDIKRHKNTQTKHFKKWTKFFEKKTLKILEDQKEKRRSQQILWKEN